MGWDAIEMSLETLREAASDRLSGSAVIAARAADALVDISCTLPDDAVVDGCRLLVEGQPLMAACLRLAGTVMRALDEGGPTTACDVARDFARSLRGERRSVVAALRERIPDNGTVVTVSSSSTVVEALRHSPRVRVLCALSEPGGEGRAVVDDLRAAGVEADLIPDGAVAQQSARADLVVFGADAVGPGALMNKIGSLAAALGARSGARPCVCAAGSTKLVDGTAWPLLVHHAEGRRVEGIPIFEEVPLGLIRTIVTDEGARSARTIRKIARAAALHPEVLRWLKC